MSRYFFLCFFLLLLMGCTSEQQKIANTINDLEGIIESNSDPEIANQLIDNYKNYLKSFPEDRQMNPRYLYRIAEVYYRMDKFQESEKYLKQSLKQYPKNENAFNVASLLGSIYEENFGNTFIATSIYQNMVTTFSSQDLSSFQQKLPQDLPPLDKRLSTVQLQIFDTTGVINYQKANDFVNASELSALINPDRPSNADNLFKAAETARTIRAHEKALDIYKWIHDDYSDHPKAPQALFLQAFTLDNELGKIEEARTLYEKFIADYPGDDFADDAQFLLKNLGKSNEEIIKSFEQQNQTE